MFSFFYEEIELSFFNLEVFILVRYAYTGRRARQRMAEIIRELSSSIEVKVRKFLNVKGQNFLVFGNFLVVLMFLQKMLWLWFMFYLCPFWKGGVWSQDFRSNFVN